MSLVIPDSLSAALSDRYRLERERELGQGTSLPHSNYDGQTVVMVGFNQASRIVAIQNLPALITP